MTEPERLGRRTRHEVSKRGWLAFLSTPFLPGGGRGVLFVVVTSFLIGGSLGIARAIGPSGAMTHLEAPVMGGLFCAFGYIVTAIAFPSAFLTQRTGEPRGRFVVRCIIFAAVLLATITPALTAVVLGGGRVLDFNHIGNPFYFAYGPAFGGDVIFVFAACVFVTLVANIPRITRGIEEVQEASRARRRPNTNNAQAPS